jgi:hypothetical protein
MKYQQDGYQNTLLLKFERNIPADTYRWGVTPTPPHTTLERSFLASRQTITYRLYGSPLLIPVKYQNEGRKNIVIATSNLKLLM